MEKLVKVEDFNTSWDSHYNRQKTYYSPAKRPTIDVPVKLLSRGRAPSCDDEAIAGSHIDDLTSETDGVGASKTRVGEDGMWELKPNDQLGAPDNFSVKKQQPILFQDFFAIYEVINQDFVVEHCS